MVPYWTIIFFTFYLNTHRTFNVVDMVGKLWFEIISHWSNRKIPTLSLVTLLYGNWLTIKCFWIYIFINVEFSDYVHVHIAGQIGIAQELACNTILHSTMESGGYWSVSKLLRFNRVIQMSNHRNHIIFKTPYDRRYGFEPVVLWMYIYYRHDIGGLLIRIRTKKAWFTYLPFKQKSKVRDSTDRVCIS